MILPLLLNKLHSNTNFFILPQWISKINEISLDFLKIFEAASETFIQFRFNSFLTVDINLVRIILLTNLIKCKNLEFCKIVMTEN